jgi:hypothetical protein
VRWGRVHRGTMSAGIEGEEIGHLDSSTAFFRHEANRAKDVFQIVKLANVIKRLFSLGVIFVPTFQDERNAFGIGNASHTKIGQNPINHEVS